MPVDITELFMCPLCKCDLRINSEQNNLVCVKDVSHSFSYENQVLDFSGIEAAQGAQLRTKESFGVEWSEYYPRLGFSDKEFEKEKNQFITYTRGMPNFFNDKIVLDAGCGNGRYSYLLNHISQPRMVIACDISNAVYVARKNLADLKNMVFVKCDLRRLKDVLKLKIDYIMSIGVLHHTPNARESFLALSDLVADGGFFSCFLYGKGNPVLNSVNLYLRNNFLQRFSRKNIMIFCRVLSIPYYILRSIKVLGPWIMDLMLRFVFIGNVHNMYDAYTAGYTSFHTRDEVEEWYRTAGFEAVIESRLRGTALYCIGRKMKLSR